MALTLDHVQVTENYQANVHEWFRRAEFEAQTGVLHREQWLQKWEADGSLLKFED
jgi:hypothetical protein